MTLHNSLLRTPFVQLICQNRLLVAAYVPGLADTPQKAIWGRKWLLMASSDACQSGVSAGSYLLVATPNLANQVQYSQPFARSAAKRLQG